LAAIVILGVAGDLSSNDRFKRLYETPFYEKEGYQVEVTGRSHDGGIEEAQAVKRCHRLGLR
jgi:hypothetical protein